MVEKGVLYIVPTPIGNLGDITLRALEVLRSCDFVAAEDTRVGGKLLMLLDIKKPLVSYREHNKNVAGDRITSRINQGESCALISDAGTPAISDPGSDLVRLCVEQGIKIIPLPGASALTTALSASGIQEGRFCFEGFLPKDTKEKRRYLQSAAREVRTLVYYVPPHDLEKVVAELLKALGNRECVLAKEITKINEKFFYTRLEVLRDEIANMAPVEKKGEFVLIVKGLEQEEDSWESLTVEEHLSSYIKLGHSKMEACKLVASDRSLPKSEVYKTLLEMSDV